MNVTRTTRPDQCPPGLVLVAAHGQIPGGLAWKHESGEVSDIAATDWIIQARDTPRFEGVPMTAIPTETAAASTDPRVRAYVTGPHSTGRSGITISNNTKENHA